MVPTDPKTVALRLYPLYSALKILLPFRVMRFFENRNVKTSQNNIESGLERLVARFSLQKQVSQDNSSPVRPVRVG